ncbi:TPA: tetratricopeptide repeat protein, partial [Photobacterium damselae]
MNKDTFLYLVILKHKNIIIKHNRDTMRILMLFMICIVMAGCSQNNIRTTSQDNNVKFNDTIKELKEVAKQGDAKAQYYLGMMYLEGKGLPQDDKRATHWFQKAAKQGDAEA